MLNSVNVVKKHQGVLRLAKLKATTVSEPEVTYSDPAYLLSHLFV